MTSDLESDLLVVLYDVARQMRTVVDQIAREHGRTRAQWIILLRLEREPGLSQNELAAIAEVAPITIARLVDRLEECGLVERRPDPQDRRIWRLWLRPAAKPLLRNVKQYRAEVQRLMTRGVDRAVLKTMVAGLCKMKENLSTSRRAARQGGGADRPRAGRNARPSPHRRHASRRLPGARSHRRSVAAALD